MQIVLDAPVLGLSNFFSLSINKDDNKHMKQLAREASLSPWFLYCRSETTTLGPRYKSARFASPDPFRARQPRSVEGVDGSIAMFDLFTILAPRGCVPKDSTDPGTTLAQAFQLQNYEITTPCFSQSSHFHMFKLNGLLDTPI